MHSERTIRHVTLAATAAVCPAALASDFATRVVDFSPAPGQRINVPPFSNPANALGPPRGGGTTTPDQTKVVTLGGFGGSITLGFDGPVWDNPRNSHGMDLILFGNSSWVGGDPTRRYAEAGTVEVSRDANGNGLADDPWYLIPGSHLAPPYARATRTWDTATGDPTYPPSSPAWLPQGSSGQWTTNAYPLPSDPFAGGPGGPIISHPDGPGAASEFFFGYADSTPTLVLGDTNGDNVADTPLTPEQFYTVPDDPLVVGISAGSGGGDSIDLAWAVDPATGAPANLAAIHFVRVTTPVDSVHQLIGEISAEVGGAADVRPVYRADWDGDADVAVADIFAFLSDWFAGSGEAGGADFDRSGATSVADIFAFLAAWFGD